MTNSTSLEKTRGLLTELDRFIHIKKENGSGYGVMSKYRELEAGDAFIQLLLMSVSLRPHFTSAARSVTCRAFHPLTGSFSISSAYFSYIRPPTTAPTTAPHPWYSCFCLCMSFASSQIVIDADENSVFTTSKICFLNLIKSFLSLLVKLFSNGLKPLPDIKSSERLDSVKESKIPL